MAVNSRLVNIQIVNNMLADFSAFSIVSVFSDECEEFDGRIARRIEVKSSRVARDDNR